MKTAQTSFARTAGGALFRRASSCSTKKKGASTAAVAALRNRGSRAAERKACMGTALSCTAQAMSSSTLGSFEASDIDGKLVKLEKYVGKVVLVVNVASK